MIFSLILELIVCKDENENLWNLSIWPPGKTDNPPNQMWKYETLSLQDFLIILFKNLVKKYKDCQSPKIDEYVNSAKINLIESVKVG